MEKTPLPELSAGNRYYDNTMLSAYKDCPRKYLIRHILGWRGTGVSHALAFGLSWHSAMDTLWQHSRGLPTGARKDVIHLSMDSFLKTWQAEGLPSEPTIEQMDVLGARTPGVAQAMLDGYLQERWKIIQEAELLACEQPIAVPLPGVTDVWYIGRLDKVISLNGDILTLEHKTTTEYKKDGGFKTAYVEGWYSDSQIKGYQFGGGLFFPGHSQVWVDAALVHKTVHNAFRLIPVAHQTPLLLEWAADTREWVERIETDTLRIGTKHIAFPKNENSCMGKFGPCPFLNICRTTPDPMQLDGPPEGFVEDFWKPFDILGLDKLTNKEPK